MAIVSHEVLGKDESLSSSVLSDLEMQEEFKAYEHMALKKKYFFLGLGACSLMCLCVGAWLVMPYFLSEDHTDKMTYKASHLAADLLHDAGEEIPLAIKAVYD